jgi:hypothetical protein
MLYVRVERVDVSSLEAVMDPAGVLPYTLLEKIKYEVTRNGVG